MIPDDRTAAKGRDLLARPGGAIFWWGFPLAAIGASGALPITASARTLVCVAALAWMGVGCTLNARRCHRLHCYLSAPILFLGAAGAAAAGLGLAPFGPGVAINIALVLALATFLVEPIWGKYRTR